MAAGGKYDDGLPRLLPGEPYFVIRAQDALAPYALEAYASLLRAAAAGANRPRPEGADVATLRAHYQPRDQLLGMADEVRRRVGEMLAWQSEHGVKLPD